MSIWGKIRNDFQDGDIVYIYAFLTDDDMKKAKVIAKVNVRTKEVQYLDDRARDDSYAQVMIAGLFVTSPEYFHITNTLTQL
jgi:hypothetical protein